MSCTNTRALVHFQPYQSVPEQHLCLERQFTDHYMNGPFPTHQLTAEPSLAVVKSGIPQTTGVQRIQQLKRANGTVSAGTGKNRLAAGDRRRQHPPQSQTLRPVLAECTNTQTAMARLSADLLTLPGFCCTACSTTVLLRYPLQNKESKRKEKKTKRNKRQQNTTNKQTKRRQQQQEHQQQHRVHKTVVKQFLLVPLVPPPPPPFDQGPLGVTREVVGRS